MTMTIKNINSREIWEDRYQKNGETLDEQINRIASCVANNENEKKNFIKIMSDGLFFPAGRTMSNAGLNKKLTLNNCFTLNFVPDSMDGIFETIKKGALVHKAGGGTGYNFSLIRPSGTPTSNDAVASGVISFMNVFDSQTKTVNQGSRRK